MHFLDIDESLQPEVVEREIATKCRWLAFAPPIEALFERNGRTARLRTMTHLTFVGIALYDLFLALDRMLLPDVYDTMLVGRLCIFTPLALAMIWTSHQPPNRFRMESIAMVGGVFAVLVPTIIMARSESPFKLNYQYTNILIIMFVAVVMRVRFRYSVVGLVSSFIIHFSVIKWYDMFGAADTVAIGTIYLVCVTTLAIAAYLLEYDERTRFLFALHATLLRDQITRAARTDALTGLFNRGYLAEYFETLAGPPPARTVVAILLDIDHFKAFNDSCGHVEGDDCLRRVSAAVAAVAAPHEGVTFRFGGEEILVLVRDMDLADGMRLAEAVRAGIEAAAIPHPALGAGRVVSASLGVAGGLVPDVTLRDLVEAADTALYAAKRSGRNRALPGPILAAAQQDGSPSAGSGFGDTVAPAANLC